MHSQTGATIRLKHRKTDAAQDTYLTLFKPAGGIVWKVYRSFFEVIFQDVGFVSVKCNITLPAGSVSVARRGGLVPSVPLSPCVARKEDLVYSVPPRGPCSRDCA